MSTSRLVFVLQLFVELVERLEGGRLVAEDITLEPVWKSFLGLVFDEDTVGDGENLVELFQGALLSLGDEQENKDKGDDVESGIKAN